MGDIMNEKMRDEFEQAIAEEAGQPLVAIQLSRKDESYSTSPLIYAWWAWEHSRKALVIDLPTVGPEPEPPEEAIDDSYMDAHHAKICMRNACLNAIEAAGLKVAP